MDVFRRTIVLPGEAREIWKAVRAKASLEGKGVGEWIWDLIKKELQPE